ncbi:hypothetical protein DFH09DRAFT_906548, partial [Mycena vulgaris]
PAFPLELEREIFEICVLSRPKSIAKLMLVACRVKEWVEPFLYRTIALDVPPQMDDFPSFKLEIMLSMFKRKPTSFFRDAVLHLHIPWYYCLDPILPVCTGVQNLSLDDDLFFGDEIIQLLAPLRPTHLCIDLDPILRTLRPGHSFFSQITHLELLGSPDFLDISTGLALVPRLTHLSFNQYVRAALQILETCKSLSVLVID